METALYVGYLFCMEEPVCGSGVERNHVEGVVVISVDPYDLFGNLVRRLKDDPVVKPLPLAVKGVCGDVSVSPVCILSEVEERLGKFDGSQCRLGFLIYADIRCRYDLVAYIVGDCGCTKLCACYDGTPSVSGLFKLDGYVVVGCAGKRCLIDCVVR